MERSAGNAGNQERPLSLDEARAEFPGPVFRLEPANEFEVAAVGTSRRDGRLTGASLSYFDLEAAAPKAKTPAWSGAPEWMAVWLARISEHPLVSEVVRIWTLDEFGGAEATEAAMLELHIDYVLANSPLLGKVERPQARNSPGALNIDGSAVPGVVAENRQLTAAAARVGDVLVSVAVAGQPSWNSKRTLTSH